MSIIKFRESLSKILSGSKKGYMQGVKDYDKFLKDNDMLSDNLKFYGMADCPLCESCFITKRVALYFNPKEHTEIHYNEGKE